MIKSNLTEERQRCYLAYLSEHYKPLWTLQTIRGRSLPVISLDALKSCFGIEIPDTVVNSKSIVTRTLEGQFNIANPVFSLEQLKAIAFMYKLTNRRCLVDLLVAHELLRYDNYISNTLVLLLEDMYNAVQLHLEFCNSVCSYLRAQMNLLDVDISVNIDVNPDNGICYKELMDYAHYNGLKPQISFKISYNNSVKKCIIGVNDYELIFTNASYNIDIRNIKFV